MIWKGSINPIVYSDKNWFRNTLIHLNSLTQPSKKWLKHYSIVEKDLECMIKTNSQNQIIH